MDFYIKISDTEKILVGSLDHGPIGEAYFNVTGSCEVSSYAKLVANRDVAAIPYKYRNMISILGLENKQAILAIPRHALKEHVSNCILAINEIFENETNLQYFLTHVSNKRFLDSLDRARVDEPKLKRIMIDTSNPTTLKTLASMLPRHDGYCEQIEYASTGTSTGRLTVVDGPQILTVPVAARRCLVSDFKGGSVLQLDIVSAEPKFALHAKGADPPDDVYAHIASTILNGTVERSHAKLITLCALYGQSPKKLKEKLPRGIDVNKVISQTKEYFGVDELVRQLRRQYDTGDLRNALGRPLFIEDASNHLLISHFLQSSVAEGAILMFQQFLSNIGSGCKALYVVHDALLVDAEPEVAHRLLTAKNIKLKLGSWIFTATIKLVEDS